MEIKVHCPQCKAVLRVPVAAVGRAARCPACQTTFRVPSPREDLEDTASNWIEEDVDHLKEEHDQQWQRMAIEERRRQVAEQRERSARAAQRLQELLSAEARTADHGSEVISRVDRSAPARPEKAAATATVKPSPISRPSPQPPVSVPDDGRQTTYPDQIEAPAQRPHLVIESCTQRGVRIVFDSRWLEHDGFSLSMPLRCPFTNESNRQQLICKPLAFCDRSQAAVRHPLEIERGHEQRLGERSPREVRDQMGVLEQLPPPFNRAVPYYVSQAEAGQSLSCTTMRRPDGIMACVVQIPDGHHALEWVARVNGVCGPEYALLERDVTQLFTDHWRGVDQRSRQRIAAWCEFEVSERFEHYFPDADFAKKDEGLAGIVITDRRAIYNKYHRHGEARPGPATRVVIRPDAEFASVTFCTPDGNVKAVRLHFDEIHSFAEAMRHLGFHLDIETKL